MYSWRTIRTFCVLLLCLPLVHFAYLLSGDILATLDSSPNAWADELEDYAEADREATLPKDPIVVVGGRRASLWRGLDELLAPSTVLMRGLGDATIEDILFHYDRLVAFYQPSAVVLLPGDSEFHIRDSKSAEDYMRAIIELSEHDAALSSQWQLVLYTPLKTPLRPGDHQKIDDIASRLSVWGNEDPRITVIDANTLLANTAGNPNPAYFRPDGTNLNDAGYLRLAIPLKSALETTTAVLESAD